MSTAEYLLQFVNKRLSAAAEEILGVFGRTIVEYEEEIQRQRGLLDICLKPKVKLHRIDQRVLQEEVHHTEQQPSKEERISNRDQEEPELPQVKDEPEELRASQDVHPFVPKQEDAASSSYPTRDASEENTTAASKTILGDNNCKICGKRFHSKSYLSIHIRTHTGEKPFSCSTCGKRFTQKAHLSEHRKLHTHPYCCKFCGKRFNQSQFLAHQTDKCERPYPCNTCGRRFGRKKSLAVHQKRHGDQCHHKEKEDHMEQQPSNQEKISSLDQEEPEELCTILVGDQVVLKQEDDACSSYPTCDVSEVEENSPDASKTIHGDNNCEICGKRFQCKSHLTIHRRAHTGERPFACSTCGKRFSRKSHFNEHRRLHTHPYCCSICRKRFVKKSEYIAHEQMQKCESPYPCTTCGKSFSRKSHFNEHRRLHTHPYQCSICRQRFVKKSEYIAHEQMQKCERPYPCSTCGKSFLRKSDFNEHRRLHTHPYCCSICRKRFVKKSEHIAHEQMQNCESPYPCSTCGKTFTQKARLTRHHRLHTHPYNCSICGKRFANQSQYIAHAQIDSCEKPYSCNKCWRRFPRKKSLIVHQRLHRSERPYPCSTCGKRFTQKSHLNGHQRLHTHPYYCSTCGKRFAHQSQYLAHDQVDKCERPYPCNTCGRRFTMKKNLSAHQKLYRDQCNRKAEEGHTEQQPGNQERISSLDQEEPEPPQVKEEPEELRTTHTVTVQLPKCWCTEDRHSSCEFCKTI